MERPKRGLSAFDDIERLDQLGEVGKRPRQPVDLVDDDHVDLSRASASTAPPRPANQMRRAWLTIWPNRPMRIMIGSMTEAEIAALESWAADVGLKGSTEIALVEGFCDRALAAGLPLARAAVFIDTLHPIYEGRTFRWERENHQATLTEYGRSTEGELAERWRASPWFRLLRDGELMLRRRITAETESEFASFPELRAASITDYVATVHPFAADGRG